MYKIKIENDVSYAGYHDIFTVEPGELSVSITHEATGFMNLDNNPKTIDMPLKEYKTIADTFENIDFKKILEESDVLMGYDGWILKCTISKGITDVSVSLWCPSKDPEKPETTKLLDACNKVCNLFPEVVLYVDSNTDEDEKACDEIMKDLQINIG